MRLEEELGVLLRDLVERLQRNGLVTFVWLLVGCSGNVVETVDRDNVGEFRLGSSKIARTRKNRKCRGSCIVMLL
jgi:hypothetical protein